LCPHRAARVSIQKNNANLAKLSALFILLIAVIYLVEKNLFNETTSQKTTTLRDEEIGLKLIEQKNYEAEIRFYRQRIFENPGQMSAKINLAFALKNSRKIREAENIYLDLIAKHPSENVIFNNLGVMYSQSERLDEAE
jgi:tetratricopeptide (TPR) repeat protein